MVEAVVGLFGLFLGWLCLDHVARVRALYSENNPPRSRFYGPKPLMIVPSVLGALFILNGLALLTLAAVEWFQISNGGGYGISSEMILALVLVPAGVAALVLLGRHVRRG
jgi:hypothetical protein